MADAESKTEENPEDLSHQGDEEKDDEVLDEKPQDFQERDNDELAPDDDEEEDQDAKDEEPD